MSLILRSNGLYTGADTLPTLASLTHTYAKYKARVEADGGYIVDETACSDAFDFLIAQSVPPHLAFVVGASFGIKKSNTDVKKMYSFDGNDMVLVQGGSATEDPQFDDTTYAYPVIDMQSIARPWKTQALTRIQANDGYCFAQAIRDNASDGRIGTYYAFYPSGVNRPPAGLEAYNGDFGITSVYAVAPRPGYNTAALQSVANANIRSTLTPYAAFDGVCMHARYSTGVMKVYANNVLQETITDVGNKLFDMRQQAVYLGHGYSEEQGNSFSFYSYQIGEIWQVKDCSESFAQALSSRLGTLY